MSVIVDDEERLLYNITRSEIQFSEMAAETQEYLCSGSQIEILSVSPGLLIMESASNQGKYTSRLLSHTCLEYAV